LKVKIEVYVLSPVFPTMSTIIRDYWLARPGHWFAVGEDQRRIDAEIYDRFYTYDFEQETKIGRVIYLDQFVRHFSRVTSIPETTVGNCRYLAAELVGEMTDDELLSATGEELVWYLMPFKHMGAFKNIFEVIDAWVRRRDGKLMDSPQLERFFIDTYGKAYTSSVVQKNVKRIMIAEDYDRSICESHPVEYDDDGWIKTPSVVGDTIMPLCAALETVLDERIAVSLSGGVDSMTMCALLKLMKKDVIAIHIVYGNRAESVEERKFLTIYCARLGIPFYVYNVEWLRRGDVDRAFYEETTRRIRFDVYKAFGRPVLLGHIMEDVVENIWTNIAKGTHLDNLAKMTTSCVEDEVTIYRPWLTIGKAEIYEAAHTLAIPYLKNTTPSWSNRGKFREQFYAATHAQYGVGVDNQLVMTAERLRKTALLVDRILYTPILESWDGERLDITVALTAKLDADGWLRIFTELAHKHLRCGKPSIHACANFAERTMRGIVHAQTIILRKDYAVEYCVEGEKVYLKVKN